MNPKPRLVQRDKEPTRAEIEMAHIQQNWREWRSPWSDVAKAGWEPINGSGANPLNTDVVRRATYTVKVDAPIGFWRSLLRKVRGL